MADDDEIAIVCLAVSADRDPGDPSSTRGHYCMECATEVWMSKPARDFWKDNPHAQITCSECVRIEDLEDVRALPGDKLGQQIVEAFRRYGL